MCPRRPQAVYALVLSTNPSSNNDDWNAYGVCILGLLTDISPRSLCFAAGQVSAPYCHNNYCAVPCFREAVFKIKQKIQDIVKVFEKLL